MTFITTLRTEIDNFKSNLNDKKSQNAELHNEMERQKENLDNRNVEISRMKGDLTSQQDLHSNL